MQTYHPETEDVRQILSGWFRTPGVTIPSNDPLGVVSPTGMIYVALHNTNGMLAVYRLSKNGWRKTRWVDVPPSVLEALEGNAGLAPEQYRIWAQ